MTYGVVVWGTGTIGRNPVRSVLGHRELELTGVIVNDPAKEGRDVGELCGLPGPTGIVASRDAGAVLASAPDAVCYTAIGTGARDVARPGAARDDICRLLEAGFNVTSTSLTSMVYPPTAEPEDRVRLEESCRKGGTSCFFSGVHPGFATDLLPLTLSGFCTRIDAIVLTEIISYERWHKFDKLRHHFGFGMPSTETPPIFEPGVASLIWGSVVGMVADQLDVALDRVEEHHERWVTPAPRAVRAGVIEAGTTAAALFSLHGIRGGDSFIVLDHVYRAFPEAAPEWPAPPGTGGYRVVITGEPSWTCDLAMADAEGCALPAGEMATATRVVNSVPAVCEAASGLLVPSDLPLITGRHRVGARP